MDSLKRRAAVWVLAALSAAIPAGCGPGTVVAVVVLAASSGGSDDGGTSLPPPAEGIPDSTFGGSGRIVLGDTAGGGGSDLGWRIAIDTLGRIIVSGESSGPVNKDMIVWRLLDDGSLDPSFFGQGWVTHDNAAGGGGDDHGRAGLALDPWGRILVAGTSWGGTARDWDVAIWRLYDNGSLDTTFGGQGWIARNNIAGGGDEDTAFDMTIDDDGRILVTGYSQGASGNRDMFIVRYNPDGTPDNSFGSAGAVVHGNAAGGNNTDGGQGIVVDAAGRILATGFSTGTSGENYMVVWRYTPFGVLDMGFGGQGFVLCDTSGGANPLNRGEAISIDRSGKIVVAGWSRSLLGNTEMTIWRCLDDGNLDTSFAGRGWATHGGAAGVSSSDEGFGMTLDPHRNILVAGWGTGTGTGQDMVLWRFQSDGLPDPSLRSSGTIVEVNTAGGNGSDVARAVTIDADGRIVATGWSRNPAGYDAMVLWRYR